MAELLGVTDLQRWCHLLADALGHARAQLDEINVFPVPDGDTGTNLYMTVVAAAEAIDQLPLNTQSATAWRVLADGALVGARGNSGVILSQILRGMGDVLGRDGELGDALRNASVKAYEAVSKPVEGTMLTVLRVAADSGSGDSATAARAVAQRARVALAETTAQLDVLASSGVVDAGAAGLCLVLDTLATVICDENPCGTDIPTALSSELSSASGRPQSPGRESDRYEVSYLIEVSEIAMSQLRAALDQLGGSVVMAGENGLTSVHVHTDDAGAVIEAGSRIGRPYNIRVTYIDTPR